jgi:type 1 glutamine amidotransferase
VTKNHIMTNAFSSRLGFRLACAISLSLFVLVGAIRGAEGASSKDVPHVVVFSHTAGFRHMSIDHAKEVLSEWSKTGGFTVEFTEDPKALTAETLARTDVWMWLSNTAGTDRVSPFTKEQQAAYVDWMLCGGAHLGVHAATDSYGEDAFPEYVEATGAIFTGHPLTVTSAADDQTPESEGWGEPEATLLVKDPKSPMNAPWRGEESFQFKDEYYKLDRDPADTVTRYNLLLALGEFTDPQALVTHQIYPGAYPEDAPIAWSGSFRGKNRTFYTNLGHSVVTWDNPDFQEHLVNGIKWVAKKRVSDGCLERAGFPN